MQKMGSMPGGPGPMETMPGAPMPGGPGMARPPDEGMPRPPLAGGPGPMDPPLGRPSAPLDDTMRDDDYRDEEPAGLLPSPRSDSERFFEDMKLFVADTEQLLRQARTLTGEGALVAREEFERRLAQARDGFDQARTVAMDRMNDVRDRTEAYVRRDPWKAIGIAAGVGFLIGMLSGRGSDE